MADQELSLILRLKDEASKQLDTIAGKIEGMSGQFKAVGSALTGVGVGITASLGLAVKAALDEEIGINRLGIALKNVGVNYDQVKGSLEANILATQRKTGIADSEQRDALNQLVLVTGDYDTALKWLPLSLDLAAAKQINASSAAMLMGRAAMGNTTLLARYGLELKEGATAAEIFAAMQGKVGGAAEAAANPLNILKASMGDMVEKIGTFLIPLLKNLVDNLVPIIEKVQAWADEHPELTRQLVILAAVVGVFASVLGPILIALPFLVAGMAALMGPVGLVVLAIVALVAAGVLLWQNWDAIVEKAGELWEGLKTIFAGGVNFLIGLAEGYANAWIFAINLIIAGLNFIKVSIPSWVPGIGGQSFGINLPSIPEIALPRLAAGGIVTSPTLALLGERGPEAVVPLGAMGNITININATALMGNEAEARAFARQIVSLIREDNRIRYFGRAA